MKLVFPIQAKQFSIKLTSTSWDLCRSDRLIKEWTSITTGFSGTDDLHIVLPQSVKQKNIEELEMTNGHQLKCLLREENNSYKSLEAIATCNQILKLLPKHTENSGKINVVLDAGALILEMSNEDFSKAWLRTRDDMEAVAYFDSFNMIKVATQDGEIVTYGATSYSSDMSKCLLYLDDIHTRGSDFVLPQDTKAMLTLGKGMPKDKFIQACMRMRQLGNGQSLTFLASFEVDIILQKHFLNDKNTSSLPSHNFILPILNWTFNNNLKRNAELLPHYATQGRSCIAKSKAYDEKYFSQRKDKNVTEKSVQKLTAFVILNILGMACYNRT